MADCCDVCSASDWEFYPDPNSSHSLLSDFRIIDVPLCKRGCRACGAVRRDPIRDHDALFSTYELYAHDVGDPFETLRQRRYAAWLAQVLDAPESLFEGGAGNGSLQLALREFWPSTSMSGVEPSPAAVRRARSAGASVDCGFVKTSKKSVAYAETAFAINVIEHVTDPVNFLRGLAQHAQSRVVIVCPDGSEPWSELLFADHLRSLPAASVCQLFKKAGLVVESQIGAPQGIGKFLMTVGRHAHGPIDRSSVTPDDSLHQRRARYLCSWAQLDDKLVARTEGLPLFCFGTGEAAAILRAYAPKTWATVQACTIDGDASRFGSLRVVPYKDIARTKVLLGVQQSAQESLAARLTADGHEPIRWDDLVAA